MNLTPTSQRGSTLMVTVTTLATLSVMAAFTLQRVTPKFQEAHQTAGWQEGRLAAEAGIDAAMADLIRNAAGPAPGAWTGWRQNNGGVIGPVVSGTLDTVNTVLSLLSGSVTVSQPIFLDNLRVVTANGVPSEVDVQLWALQPAITPQRGWFRIRSMATCSLPPTAYKAPGKLDHKLRRLNLRQVRAQLKQDDIGTPMTLPTPSASRVVEVLVEPILPFELALWTNETISLATRDSWCVNSYDSRDPAKSTWNWEVNYGTYPGRTSSNAQANGHIASNGGRPADSLYGPLIYANGTTVRGSVATNGGDNPDTTARENVYGAQAVDLTRVRSDFCREMKPLVRPSGGPVITMSGTSSYTIFTAGTELAPMQYLILGNLRGFAVNAPLIGKGAVTFMVNGNLDVDSNIQIPASVTVKMYVRGNIHFHDKLINANSSSSKRPGQLQIYGEDSGTLIRTLNADGSGIINAAFYGPTYDARLRDDVSWRGAIASRSFEMTGGGSSGGIHYDEALGLVGPPVSFRIARYVEDVRE